MALTLGDPARHFFMTRSVARVMGLNLGEALNTGKLAPDTYAAMVTACRSCALVDACEKWLAGQVSLTATPPPGCCNGPKLAELRRSH
ncbi:DUF6455 family protein [Mameliella sediminis]|uniref:DUF6455 family protein n=1 Tax=Mameliella sediminis TaxID=2836866 RepID=UPI001C43DF90|nr:DUF6455 family protein [Mameliella sediminis]MBY6113744.1 hypothetical protein [Antarctobacter heliothermus]MBY6142908.1 hypothetical protein [Mameliella alba]MBV7395041.1 hypothetical protein [Mameliella sediminis]MBY6159763.1 hypothetical protein [Mameliella alba]MBY6168234.1 hypothetical protein [Mameliella alba]